MFCEVLSSLIRINESHGDQGINWNVHARPELIVNDWAELSKIMFVLFGNRSAMLKIVSCTRDMKYSVYKLAFGSHISKIFNVTRS